MGVRSTVQITREAALGFILGNLTKLTDQKLEKALEAFVDFNNFTISPTASEEEVEDALSCLERG